MLLLLAMTMSLFTACSKEEKPSEEETVKETETTEAVTEETEVSTEAPTKAPTEAPTTEEETEKGTETSEAEEPSSTEAEYPLDKENPVSDLYHEEKQDFYSYHVPQLNCDTKDGKKINEEIDKVFGEEARQGIEYGKEGLNTGCYAIDYTVHWYGDVMVLILWKQFNNDFREYAVYNVYCVTGNRMSNDGILRMLKVPQEDFIAGAQRGAEAYYRDYYPEETMGGDALYQEQLDWTLSEENINLDMMMFPGKDGSLMLISKIGSLVGASYYENIYPYLP